MERVPLFNNSLGRIRQHFPLFLIAQVSFTAFLMEMDTKDKHRIKEVKLSDRINSFRSVSHSFPKKMAQESVKLIFFELENYGGKCVVWP